MKKILAIFLTVMILSSTGISAFAQRIIWYDYGAKQAVTVYLQTDSEDPGDEIELNGLTSQTAGDISTILVHSAETIDAVNTSEIYYINQAKLADGRVYSFAFRSTGAAQVNLGGISSSSSAMTPVVVNNTYIPYATIEKIKLTDNDGKVVASTNSGETIDVSITDFITEFNGSELSTTANKLKWNKIQALEDKLNSVAQKVYAVTNMSNADSLLSIEWAVTSGQTTGKVDVTGTIKTDGSNSKVYESVESLPTTEEIGAIVYPANGLKVSFQVDIANAPAPLNPTNTSATYDASGNKFDITVTADANADNSHTKTKISIFKDTVTDAVYTNTISDKDFNGSVSANSLTGGTIKHGTTYIVKIEALNVDDVAQEAEIEHSIYVPYVETDLAITSANITNDPSTPGIYGGIKLTWSRPTAVAAGVTIHYNIYKDSELLKTFDSGALEYDITSEYDSTKTYSVEAKIINDKEADNGTTGDKASAAKQTFPLLKPENSQGTFATILNGVITFTFTSDKGRQVDGYKVSVASATYNGAIEVGIGTTTYDLNTLLSGRDGNFNIKVWAYNSAHPNYDDANTSARAEFTLSIETPPASLPLTMTLGSNTIKNNGGTISGDFTVDVTSSTGLDYGEVVLVAFLCPKTESGTPATFINQKVIEIKKVNINGTGSIPTTFDVGSLNVGNGDYQIRVMCWDSFVGMKALAQQISFDVSK